MKFRNLILFMTSEYDVTPIYLFLFPCVGESLRIYVTDLVLKHIYKKTPMNP